MESAYRTDGLSYRQAFLIFLVKAEIGLYSKTSPFNVKHVNSAKLGDNQMKIQIST